MPVSEKFPRRERLTHKSEYQKMYRLGTKHVGHSFVCFTLRQQGQGRKFGFAVSRKVGGAVVRNRIKRYLREIYRTNRREIPDDTHIVVVARYNCAGLSFHECEEAILGLFRKGKGFDG